MRLLRENESRPEIIVFSETTAPLQKDKLLIGTQDWEYKFGAGFIKGFSWGTMTLRAAAEYSSVESNLELGEYAVEYLKRISPAWRLYAGLVHKKGAPAWGPEPTLGLIRGDSI